jgi:AcrR family transcriptional regulator
LSQGEAKIGRRKAKGRRRRLRAVDRRVLLLDAAARTFGRLGGEGARMDDIAAEARVAKGLLYRHFVSKEALLEALMERKTAEFRSRLAARLGERAPQRSAPADIVVDGLQMWVEQVARDVADFNWVEPGDPPAYRRFRDGVRSMISDTILAVAPTVGRETAVLVAAALQGVAESTTKVWREQRESVSQERLVSLLRAFCLGGLQRLATMLEIDALVDLDPRS